MVFKKQPSPALPLMLTPEGLWEIQELIRQRKKIHAIKLIRERTGLGLKEAKDLADAMEHGYQPPVSAPAGTRPPLSERVRALRDAGDRPSAVAMVQAETGMSRDEAERFVSALD